MVIIEKALIQPHTALVVAKYKNLIPCMAIKLLKSTSRVFKNHGQFTAVIQNISKQRFIFTLLKKMQSSQEKTETPSIYSNTHMQQNMQIKIRETDEKGRITCSQALASVFLCQGFGKYLLIFANIFTGILSCCFARSD